MIDFLDISTLNYHELYWWRAFLRMLDLRMLVANVPLRSTLRFFGLKFYWDPYSFFPKPERCVPLSAAFITYFFWDYARYNTINNQRKHVYPTFRHCIGIKSRAIDDNFYFCRSSLLVLRFFAFSSRVLVVIFTVHVFLVTWLLVNNNHWLFHREYLYDETEWTKSTDTTTRRTTCICNKNPHLQ